MAEGPPGIDRYTVELTSINMLRRAGWKSSDVHAGDEVTAIVAHDLRNPLTSIVAHTRMLARKAPADEAGAPIHKGADAIRRSSERMERLIDDLLDAAILQKGRLTLVRTPEEPASILQELAQNFAPVAEEQRIELQTEVGALPEVSCDRGRVLQVLGNFLGNALRVTRPPGMVAVFAQEVPGARRAAFCRLEHVFPWKVQGPHWDPGEIEEPRGYADSLDACAHCGEVIEKPRG